MAPLDGQKQTSTASSPTAQPQTSSPTTLDKQTMAPLNGQKQTSTATSPTAQPQTSTATSPTPRSTAEESANQSTMSRKSSNHWSKKTHRCETPIHKAIKFTEQINESEFFTDGPWLRRSAIFVSRVYLVIGVLVLTVVLVKYGLDPCTRDPMCEASEARMVAFWLSISKSLFHIVSAVLVRMAIAMHDAASIRFSSSSFIIGISKFTAFLLVVSALISVGNIIVRTGIANQCMRARHGHKVAHPWLYEERMRMRLRGTATNMKTTYLLPNDGSKHHNCEVEILMTTFFWVLQLLVCWKSVLVVLLLRKWIRFVKRTHRSASVCTAV